MKILVTGKQDRRLLLALAMLGAEAEIVDTFEITPVPLVWDGAISTLPPETGNTYGPPVKGKGGKIKRW